MVAADAVVKSKKRGVCANKLLNADFRVLAPTVSWWYNWFYSSPDIVPAGVSMEYLPMAWGDRADDLQGLEKYLAAGHRPTAVLALNEPNLKGQAFISPEKTANQYRRIKAIADKYKLPVVGPHMALGSAKEDSITAVDPFEGKETTYTWFIPFVRAFLHFAKPTPVYGSALHTYGELGEMKWAVDTMHKEFNRPVWITEFNRWKGEDRDRLVYLVQATDFLERTPYVERYAWFKERAEGGDAKYGLLGKAPGQLTPLGKAYVGLPVHDADLYYRIPGKLQAGRYVAMSSSDMWPDEPGMTHMVATDNAATLDYNLYVPQTGRYKITFHAGGTGQIAVMLGERAIGATPVDAPGGVTTASTSVLLEAGTKKLSIRLANKGQSLYWIQFEIQ